MSLSSIVDKENRIEIEIENPQTLAPYIYSVLKAELNTACAAAAIRFGCEQEPSTHPKSQVQLVVNRNSARSYRGRQIQITELQAEIDKLMDEHASMASEFAREQKKHADAIVENEKLKDEIGALTARLNKVEERVEQLMKVNPMFILNFRTHGSGMQFGGSQVNHASSNVEFNMGPRSIPQRQPDLDN